VQKAYECADCGHEFDVQFSDAEWAASIAEGRQEECPQCGQRVGQGRTQCGRCRHEYVVRLPHRHRGCDLASANCPMCGEAYVGFCTC
jgi:DNA-directed RNA polymerase subunit RPC12/RpoP